MDYTAAVQDSETPGESEGGEGLWGGEDGMRCCGMCTHSEVLLQWVSILLLRVEGGRRDMGVTVMETKSAHTDHEIQGYITGTACNRIRT